MLAFRPKGRSLVCFVELGHASKPQACQKGPSWKPPAGPCPPSRRPSAAGAHVAQAQRTRRHFSPGSF